MEYFFLEIWRFENRIALSEKKTPLVTLFQSGVDYDHHITTAPLPYFWIQTYILIYIEAVARLYLRISLLISVREIRLGIHGKHA